MGWLFICVFRALGLARVGSLAPIPNIVRDRADLDAVTVRALFTHRLHVLRDYRRRVIQPVFRELTKQENVTVLARSSVQLLVRHPKLLDEGARQQLRELLDRYEVLRTVIEFRDRLQQIWDDNPLLRQYLGALDNPEFILYRIRPTRIRYMREWALDYHEVPPFLPGERV